MRLWADIETTGLNQNKDLVLEVALAVTDNDLNVTDCYSAVIYHSEEDVMSRVNDWCLKTHTESGLLTEVFSEGLLHQDVQYELIQFLKKHDLTKPVLHGSSIHFDKKFLDLHFPDFAKLLHYRLMDVSSIKEYLRPFNVLYISKIYGQPSHRAILDIHASIDELKYYQQFVKTP